MSHDSKDRVAWDALDRALLGSARLDEPPLGSRAALERALGLDQSAEAEPNVEPVPGPAAPTAPGVPLGTLKGLVALGAVAALVGIGALYQRSVGDTGSELHAPESSLALPRERAAKPHSPAQTPAPTGMAITPSLAPAEAPSDLGQARVRPALRRAPSSVASARTATLALEVELIERARLAVARNDAESALQELAKHERLAPPHALQAEAELVRVTALLALGRHEQAEQLANSLIRRHPGDAVARRAADLMQRFSK